MKQGYILKGLGCANCAAKMERSIGKIKGVVKANIHFPTQKLTLDIEENMDLEDIKIQVQSIVQDIESHVQLMDEEIPMNKQCLNFSIKDKMSLILGGMIFFIALLLSFDSKIEMILYGISYCLIGGDIVLKALKTIVKRQWLDENFLMVVASISAFSVGEYPEAVAVLLFFKIGEILEHIAVEGSRKSIESVLKIRPDYANLKIDGKVKKVSPKQVKVGDYIMVKPGERIPLDGVVVKGNGVLDTSPITGESLPQTIQAGDGVYSGCINKSGVLDLKVSKTFEHSTVSKILELVQEASSQKAPTEKFITKFAKVYTPIIVCFAMLLALIPPLVLKDGSFSQWVYRAAIFLVVSCPCALVISIPLGFFAGIGRFSKEGILVKGGNYIEALRKTKAIVFDKTGTLTKGNFKVENIYVQDHLSKDVFIDFLRCAEHYSNHPLAQSIKRDLAGVVIEDRIKNYKEVAGYGIECIIDGKKVLAGNEKWLEQHGISPYNKFEGCMVHMAIQETYAGCISLCDTLKEGVKEGIESLKKSGIEVYMITGDVIHSAYKIGQKVGINNISASLLPHEKVQKVEEIQKHTKGNVAFVGDGMNDAPVLTRSDIGIAMGEMGSDMAIESADVILMKDEIEKISRMIKISHKTNRIIWQNIIFSLGIKLLVLILGAKGMATMWEAVFADVGVTLIVIINAIRIIHTKE